MLEVKVHTFIHLHISRCLSPSLSLSLSLSYFLFRFLSLPFSFCLSLCPFPPSLSPSFHSISSSYPLSHLSFSSVDALTRKYIFLFIYALHALFTNDLFSNITIQMGVSSLGGTRCLVASDLALMLISIRRCVFRLFLQRILSRSRVERRIVQQ